jgi:hypothetical protein
MLRIILLLLTGLCLLTSSQATPVTGNFVAQSPGAFVGIVTSQNKAMVYICDGAQLAQWYRGPIQSGGLLEAVSNNQQSRITAQVLSHSIIGTITLQHGQTFAFKATPASGKAGLYRSEHSLDGKNYLGGWIIAANGEQRGAVIGAGSTRPGRMLEFNAEVASVRFEDLGLLKPFQITPEWVTNINLTGSADPI